jgi:hypothetical protein
VTYIYQGIPWGHNTHLFATFDPGFFFFKSRLKSFSANSMNLSSPSGLPPCTHAFQALLFHILALLWVLITKENILVAIASLSNIMRMPGYHDPCQSRHKPRIAQLCIVSLEFQQEWMPMTSCARTDLKNSITSCENITKLCWCLHWLKISGIRNQRWLQGIHALA